MTGESSSSSVWSEKMAASDLYDESIDGLEINIEPFRQFIYRVLKWLVANETKDL